MLLCKSSKRFSPHFSTNFHVHFFHCPTKMDSSRFLRNVLLNVVNHRQTNLAFTSLLTFGGLYILFASILDRSLFHPLIYNSSSVSVSSSASTTSSPPYSSVTFRPFVLFLLWAFSLAIGHLLRLLFLPSLLGPLLVGIFLANFPSFSSFFPIPSTQISSFIVEFAFVLILLRSGLGLNANFIRRQLALCSGLSIICPLAECLAIVLLAHFAYQIRLSTAIIFGFILAPSSPAVIIPTILRLQSKEYGTESGVPTAVLYSTSFDNIFSLAAFSISFEIVSAQSDELSYTLTRLPIELLIGAILGILAGISLGRDQLGDVPTGRRRFAVAQLGRRVVAYRVLLRSFPRSDAHWVHFQRAFLLLISGCAFHFGCRSIGCTLAGPMAVFLMAATGSMQWQMDNHRRTRMEENGFRLIWELFANPLLFLLLGTFLDFSSPPFSFALLGQSLLILLLSLAIRFISSLAIAFACFQPSQPQERIFLGLALLPKGTLQTALLPFIYHPQNEDGLDLLGQTSLLALLLCAPIGELAIRLLGPILLRQKMLPSVVTSIVPSGPTLLKGKVTHSDPRDNLLRLELGPTDPVDPPNEISPPFQPPANQMRNFRQKEKSKL